MSKNKAMARLYTDVGSKLVDIENIFERCGIPMRNITLFARDPNNDKRTILLSSEKSNDDIRRALEIVISSSGTEATASESEVLSVLLLGG